jgi:hypothetical protein
MNLKKEKKLNQNSIFELFDNAVIKQQKSLLSKIIVFLRKFFKKNK